MSAPPRVVLVLDPRPGEQPADGIALPAGGTLVDLVGQRAVSEAGQLEGTVRGASGVIDLLGRPAEPGAGPLALVDAGALALGTTYGDVVADPRPESSVLRAPAGRALAVRLDPAAANDPDTLDLIGRSLRRASAGAALGVLADALVAARWPVRAIGPGEFPLTVVGAQDGLATALGQESGVDESALRLRRSSRADDGFLSTFLVRPVSRQLTKRAVPAGLRPAAITAVSGILGLAAAAAYARGQRGWLIAGSLVLLLSLVIDCVDGEVARYTRTFSPLGGWLDVGSDRVKEYAVYAGLAWAADPHAWGLAAAAFAVLVVRHFVDFGYAATVSAATSANSPGVVASLSERTSARPAVKWAKRAVVMPVGERTIILAVLTPIVGPRWTLWVLLVTGCIAAAYTLAGRLGRMAALSGRARVSWLEPALARLVEQGGLVLLVGLARPTALPGAYLLLAVIAIHQYDVVYRCRLTGADAARARTRLDLVPWPARVVVVAALTLALPAGPLGWVLAALGVVLGVAAVADSVQWWRSFVRSGL